MTEHDDTEQDRRRDAWAAEQGAGVPVGGPAKRVSVDGEQWWAERSTHYWRRWHGGLPLSPARFDVSIRIGVVDGELVATGLHIETHGEPLRDRDLRDVSIRQLLDDLPESDRLKSDRPPLDRDVSALRPTKPGRRGYPDEHFAEVADVYREVRERYPDAATSRTARALHASPATIRRWLARARDLGYLQEDDS